jgi:mRNA interferase MazF
MRAGSESVLKCCASAGTWIRGRLAGRRARLDKRTCRGESGRTEMSRRESRITRATGTKTTISTPDPLFEQAEAPAHQLGKSRSQLYREALADYVRSSRTRHHDWRAQRPGRRTRIQGRRLNSRSQSPGCRTQRVVVAQGDVCWASLAEPTGSGLGFRRPVVVVEGDVCNGSRLATVVAVPLTSNLRWETAPGNVVLAARRTGLPCDSVANVSQIVAVDRTVLTERVGQLCVSEIDRLLRGIDLVFGRP